MARCAVATELLVIVDEQAHKCAAWAASSLARCPNRMSRICKCSLLDTSVTTCTLWCDASGTGRHPAARMQVNPDLLKQPAASTSGHDHGHDHEHGHGHDDGHGHEHDGHREHSHSHASTSGAHVHEHGALVNHRCAARCCRNETFGRKPWHLCLLICSLASTQAACRLLQRDTKPSTVLCGSAVICK